MRDRHRALRTIARVLPREFRERVFEPALADLDLDEVSKGRRRWPRVLLALESLRIGLPQYLWRRHRPTRAALVIGLAAVTVAVAAARLRYAARWKLESVQTRKR